MKGIIADTKSIKQGEYNNDSKYYDLNISTSVRLWNTNIRMNEKLLEEMYNTLNVIDYFQNTEGLLKASTREMEKGYCKKNIYQKSVPKKTKKTFRNQVSFYVRIFDNKEFYDKKELTRVIDDDNLYNYEWNLKKTQTGFQFNSIHIVFDCKNEKNNVRIESKIQKKSLKDSLIFNSEIKSNTLIINPKKFYYSNMLMVKSTFPIKYIKIGYVFEINMFVFTSGKIKIAGGINEEQINKSINILTTSLKENLKEDYYKYMGFATSESLLITKRTSVMLNSDFQNPFDIDRYELDQIIRHEYKMISHYEPCSHPGVILKYYCNTSHDDKSGKCLCRDLYGKRSFCEGRGDATKEGGCKAVTILIFQSGKVILTGGRLLEQVHQAYDFIKEFLLINRERIIR